MKPAVPRERKTLLQLQSEVKVRDPSAHAKLQISELDKAAAHSQKQRKTCLAQIEKDQLEVAQIESQIAMLKLRYDPLCEVLDEKLDRKKQLTKTLQSCVKEEKQIMGDTKGVVKTRMLDDSKLMRNMASLELETLRGYNMKPESTFHMSGHLKSSKSHTGLLPPLGGKLPRNLSATL